MSTIKEQPETAAEANERQPGEKKFWIRRTTLQKADRSFDLEFWQEQSAEERLAAASEMIRTADALQGRNGEERRLERHVVTKKKLTDAE